MNAADALLAEMNMVDVINEYDLRGSLSATEYFNFAFRLWLKRIKRDTQRAKYRQAHQKYLESDQWKEKRKARLALDNFKCFDCGYPAQCVHHLHYRTWRQENVSSDLVSLCNNCHYARHFG